MALREFEPGDMDSCAKLAAQAWPIGDHICKAPDRWRLHKIYVGIALGWSNWTRVACDDSGRVVGLLFGEVRAENHVGFPTRILGSELQVFSDILLGRHGKVERLPFALYNFLMTEFKLIIDRRSADSEIMLFLVDQDQRRTGIGTGLLDQFVLEAKKYNAARMSVYADDQASNFEFYERRGFKRAGEFYDNWSSYFNMNRSTGLRYVLDIPSYRPGRETNLAGRSDRLSALGPSESNMSHRPLTPR